MVTSCMGNGAFVQDQPLFPPMNGSVLLIVSVRVHSDTFSLRFIHLPKMKLKLISCQVTFSAYMEDVDVFFSVLPIAVPLFTDTNGVCVCVSA